MKRINSIKNQISESIDLKKLILNDKNILTLLSKVSDQCLNAIKSNKKIILAGNGGSAADAQHIAAEFVSKFNMDRKSIPALALTTDTSIITSISNDYDFSQIFSRQIESLGNEGDIFIGISTSGNSENIIQALKEGKKRGIINVGLTGKNGGKMKDLCDFCLCVPSLDTPRIQESHLMIEHILCGIIEEELFG
tara:strand:+ start:3297 stop:3878 length:582 start_codon:yes stop_codon:yes gene_type:complete